MRDETKILEGWVETTLGEIANITMGQSPKSDFYNTEGNGMPFYQGVTEYNDRYVGVKNFTTKTTKVVPKNSILFSVRAPVGKVNFTKRECCIGRGNAGMLMENGNQNFLYYLLKSSERKLQDYSSGTVFTSISGKELNIVPVMVPKKQEEQKAIANILTAFDDKIELLQAQNKTLETMAQTIFKEWFGKYQIGDELPEGWRVGKLGDKFDITIGRTPPRKETQWFSDKPIGKKWISIKDIGNCGTFIYNTAEHLSDEAIEKFNIPIIPANTTILSFKMTVGKLTITTEDMLSNEAIAHLKIKNDSNLSSEFIYLYLRDLNFNTLGSTSSIVTAINSTIIKGINFIIPKDSLLKSFQKRIIPVFEKIQNNTSQIQSLTKTRDTLLPKLMSGQVRVKNIKHTADA